MSHAIPIEFVILLTYYPQNPIIYTIAHIIKEEF